MHPSNKASYLIGPKQRPLEVRSAPYTHPQADEIVIKNHAVAINPLDHIKQDIGNLLYSWVKYPAILGTDVAGEVVEVGPNVTHFQVGDRVVGNSIGLAEKHNLASHCGFQKYTVLLTKMASHIPDWLAYEQAAAIPLGLSTAACAMFQKDQLALQYPTVSASKNSTGKTLLIWGGSTSVGSNAIQLAVAAGYEVITTASPRNFEYVKKLGAAQVFDYNSSTVIADIKQSFQGKTTAGALSVGRGAAEICLNILSSCKGDKFLSMATYPMPPSPPKRLVTLQTAFYYISGIVSLSVRARLGGVRTKFIFGDTLVDNEVGPMIYGEFLPRALAEKTFVAAPDAEVVGHGLETIQHALDVHKGGVSARKIVVTL
ncbi:Dehydrogenase azaJ [Exophiala dermatitidis]